MADNIFNFENGRNTLRLGIFGKSGCGKSNLAVRLLSEKKYLKEMFNDIYLVHPEYDFERENENWKKLKIQNIFTEFSQELVFDIGQETRSRFLENPDYKALLILDDCVSENSFSNKNRSEIAKLFTNARKFGLSLIIIGQRLTLVPQTIHSQLNYIIIFKTNYLRELKTVEDSFAFNDLKLWRKMLNQIFVDKRDFLLIDSDNEFYYRNLNLLKIKFQD